MGSELANSETAKEAAQAVFGQTNDGVDVTLIRWMLSLSPAERLATLQQFITSVETIRGASLKS